MLKEQIQVSSCEYQFQQHPLVPVALKHLAEGRQAIGMQLKLIDTCFMANNKETLKSISIITSDLSVLLSLKVF